MGRERHFQPLADHDLEDVAGADVLHALLHRLLELLLREVRAVFQIHLAFGPDIDQIQVGRSRGQLLDQGIDPPPGVVVGRFDRRPGPIEPGHGHDDDRLGHVVEDHHPIVKGEGQVGHLPVVGRGVGQPLEVAHRVVAGIAHGPGAERRQFRQVDGAQGLDVAAKLGHGIGRFVGTGRQQRPAGG